MYTKNTPSQTSHIKITKKVKQGRWKYFKCSHEEFEASKKCLQSVVLRGTLYNSKKSCP